MVQLIRLYDVQQRLDNLSDSTSLWQVQNVDMKKLTPETKPQVYDGSPAGNLRLNSATDHSKLLQIRHFLKILKILIHPKKPKPFSVRRT